MSDFDFETLNKNFEYNPESGFVFWRKGRFKGKRAGNVDFEGYRVITLNYKKMREHRACYVLFNGSLDMSMEIDHVNGVKDDNRICNLRIADSSSNKCNQKRYNKTGFKGVEFTGIRYSAKIKKNGVVFRLGSFDTAALAHDAYINAAKFIHGEYAKY